MHLGKLLCNTADMLKWVPDICGREQFKTLQGRDISSSELVILQSLEESSTCGNLAQIGLRK